VPLCLPGQSCCLQLFQPACPARWDTTSWGCGGWGDGWLCGFTSAWGLTCDCLRNGTCRNQSTHLGRRRCCCYRVRLDVRVICITMHVISRVCEGDRSWHNIEHGKGSRACAVEDTRPPSTEGLEMFSDCATCTYRGSFLGTRLALGLDPVLSPVCYIPCLT
jgi:hypothetical protein